MLKNCLSSMLCKLGHSSLRLLDDITGLKLYDQPLGWYEITKARDVGMETVVFGYEKGLKTCYDVVSVREEDRLLLFWGKPIPSHKNPRFAQLSGVADIFNSALPAHRRSKIG